MDLKFTNPPINCIHAILVGTASDSQKAEALVQAASHCPYVALYTHRGKTVIGVFTLPPSNQGWIEYPKEQPYILGLEGIKTIITDRIVATSPWSSGMTQPTAEITPCKKDCTKCPEYCVSCSGCAATIFFHAAE